MSFTSRWQFPHESGNTHVVSDQVAKFSDTLKTSISLYLLISYNKDIIIV